ncbi:MAG: 4Fe-4S dicluster domain-containing protein [Nitrospinae bacterium]|nr:4Fe-4S dicluster domain-containing protein [Nitrospinota bacterium]
MFSRFLEKITTLQNIRRIYSLFFFSLFLFLLAITDFRNIKGFEVSLFLELNPLVAISSFFTSWTLYKGLALSLLVLLPTLFLGRFFCSWVCPLGILNQWLSILANKRKASENLLLNSYRKIFRWKYYALAVMLVLAISGTLQTGLLDPISLVSRSFIVSVLPALQKSGAYLYLKQPVFSGGTLVAALFILILLANGFMPRFWCRALCPLGALLGLLSMNSIFRIRRDVEKCTDCHKCLRSCQGGCDPHAELRATECHVCMNCIAACPENALRFGIPGEKSSMHRPLDINRRRFVESGVAALFLFPMMKASVTGETLATASVIRPPGALDEVDFLRRCIKCGECMRVCPTNVIQPALLESGFEGLWTPVLINKIGYCEHHCNLCGSVCPTGAIRKISMEEKLGKAPYKTPIKIGTAFYDRGRCLPWAMNTECIVCEEVCPTPPKAIWFETVEVKDRNGKTKKLKQPYMDIEKCIGCGVCENKCPVVDLPAVRVSSVGESRSKKNRMVLKGTG